MQLAETLHLIRVMPAEGRMSDTITVTVNGEARSLPQACSVLALVGQLGLDLRKVAVERNEEIVPRSSYPDIVLLDGDALEIVHFIGGG